jgi:diaminohydroxyphosphoribosylaminopyrimidine deaminase/5-amino-6-(5-phosphoribosylamino)uracil reductase
MTDESVAPMRRALELAAMGRGWVEPNPMVGAVVVAGGQIVGEGFHRRFGGPHAEVHALDCAGDRAQNGTLYVTLEPCCHHGKTPPCTDRILASKVRRVVVAMGDPFGEVSGRGIAQLRQAGVEVDVGCLETQARALNSAYLKLITRGRPHVHAKWAMTIDGKIATVAGESKWITGDVAREHALAFRGLVDAVIVGIGTVLADNPQLTARPPGPRVPVRVVLDSRGRLPQDSTLARTAKTTPTLLATTSAADPHAVARLRQLGIDCVALPDRSGRVDVGALLDEFGRRNWTNVLIEGGAGVLGAFLEAGEIDAVRVYVSGRIAGGRQALGPVGGAGIGRLAETLRLERIEVTDLDGDLFLSARVRKERASATRHW